ncbi:Xylosidase/arabinosidase [Colletotrichum higginsianum IMI 349063]|uniref:Xylosidase/arabinosidase n=1 Tax=Colletotrichum higginsianum (strain IMI 349063) TaxID=759273 RepID=A0A1B7YRE8_COLHI|nr:Xylosidase/arabinosidase [Colletotrichum higginsianum IMI 349063]OBR14615.1 Xylosidase/arabinosidase [Colletotrichum higginsianum IMI 349063]
MVVKQVYHNPIIPGFAPDPSVVLVDGVFFLVTSSFHVFPGLPIYASTDLQEWKHIGNAINRKEQLSLEQATTAVMPLDTGNIMVASAGLFAPTIRHHDGRFYIVCTNTAHEGGSFATNNFYISTTDIWSGKWSDPIYFPFNGIDPSLFFDDDGRVYVQGCWAISRMEQPSCTIKQFEINIETGEPLSETREIWGGHARYDTEGPHIYKRGGYYYLLVAEGGTFEHHLLSIGRSRDIWGPYESCAANPIMTADGKPDEYVQNVGHGELFQDQGGAWWAAVLGVRNEDGHPPLGRETFLTAVDWPDGGWPTIAQPKMEFCRSSGVTGPGDVTTIPRSPAGVDHVYIRNPQLDNYELRGEGDERLYVLRAAQSNLSSPSGTSTFIGKRQRHIEASASVVLDLSSVAADKPVVAGLALYKDALRHVSLSYDFTSSRLTFEVVTTSKDKSHILSYPVRRSSQTLSLRTQTTAAEYKFSYQEEGGQWTVAGSVRVSDLVEREMTGPVFGLYAHALEDEGVGQGVVFRNFTVNGGTDWSC